jgi:hypothetical protein
MSHLGIEKSMESGTEFAVLQLQDYHTLFNCVFIMFSRKLVVSSKAISEEPHSNGFFASFAFSILMDAS